MRTSTMITEVFVVVALCCIATLFLTAISLKEWRKLKAKRDLGKLWDLVDSAGNARLPAFADIYEAVRLFKVVYPHREGLYLPDMIKYFANIRELLTREIAVTRARVQTADSLFQSELVSRGLTPDALTSLEKLQKHFLEFHNLRDQHKTLQDTRPFLRAFVGINPRPFRKFSI